ncbi:hypothetical protein GOBAR_DD14828 [Gossypium barbadense]|nr:hypothetical protein GOBAR_DD14828 [Gossypium barbadense]
MLTSLEKVVEWFVLQTNVQGGQVYILILPLIGKGSCSAHAQKQFLAYVEKAKTTGWLDSSFHYGNSINGKENGPCQ